MCVCGVHAHTHARIYIEEEEGSEGQAETLEKTLGILCAPRHCHRALAGFSRSVLLVCLLRAFSISPDTSFIT